MAYSGLTYHGFAADATNASEYTFSSKAIGSESSSRAVLVAVATERANSTNVPGLIVRIGGVAATKIGTAHYTSYGDGVQVFIARVPTGTTADIKVISTTTLNSCGIVWYTFAPQSLVPVDVSTNTANASTITAADVEVINGGVLFCFTQGTSSTTRTVSYNGTDTPTGDLLTSAGLIETTTLNAWHVATTENQTTNDAGFVGGFSTSEVIAISFGAEAPPVDAPTTYAGYEWLGASSDSSNGTSYTFSSAYLGAADTSRAVLVGVSVSASASTTPNLTVTIGGVSATSLASSWSTGYYVGLTPFIARVPSGTTGDIVVTSDTALIGCSVVWYKFHPSSLTALDTATALAIASGASPETVADLEVTTGGIAFLFNNSAGITTPAIYYNGVDTAVLDAVDVPLDNTSFDNIYTAHVFTSENSTTNDFGFTDAGFNFQMVGVSFGVAASTPIEETVTETITLTARYPIEATITDFVRLADPVGPEVQGDTTDRVVIGDTITTVLPVSLTDGVRVGDTITASPAYSPTLAETVTFTESANLGRLATLTDSVALTEAASGGGTIVVEIAGPPMIFYDLASPGTTYSLDVTSTAQFSELFKYAYGFTVTEIPTLAVTASGDVRPLPVIVDRTYFAESVSSAAIYAPVVSRTLRVADRLIPGYPQTVTDTVVVAGTLIGQHALRVLERLGLLDTTVPSLVYGKTLAEAIRLADTLGNFFGGELSDALVSTDAASANFFLRLPVTDAITVTDDLTKHFIVRIVTADTVTITKNQVPAMLFNPTLVETVEISAAYISPSDGFLTWVVNPQTSAVTEYTNYNFNSFAALGNRYLAARSDGLYTLDGSTDAGTSIVAQIRTALMQMNGSRFSMLKGVYLGVRGDGTYQLKIIDGAGTERVYSFIVQDMETTKIRVGKGLRARYFAFELQNTGGNDFDLDTVEIVPILAGRRV